MSVDLSPWSRDALRMLGQHDRFAPSSYAMRTGCAFLESKGLARLVDGSFCTYELTDAGCKEYRRRHLREAAAS